MSTAVWLDSDNGNGPYEKRPRIIGFLDIGKVKGWDMNKSDYEMIVQLNEAYLRDPEYLRYAQEEARRELSYKVAEILQDGEWVTLKLETTEPHPQWENIIQFYDNSALWNNNDPRLQYKYRLNVRAVRVENVVIPLPVELTDWQPQTKYMLSLNSSCELLKELYGRIKIFDWIEAHHERDVERFNEFMN